MNTAEATMQGWSGRLRLLFGLTGARCDPAKIRVSVVLDADLRGTIIQIAIPTPAAANSSVRVQLPAASGHWRTTGHPSNAHFMRIRECTPTGASGATDRCGPRLGSHRLRQQDGTPSTRCARRRLASIVATAEESGLSPLMGTEEGPHGISAEGGAAIAGIPTALPELLSVYAGSALSAQRLQRDTWSGAWASWGLENREAAVRLIARTAMNPRGANVELKVVDPSSTIYLAAAALFGSALHGIASGLPLPAEVTINPADDPRHAEWPSPPTNRRSSTPSRPPRSPRTSSGRTSSRDFWPFGGTRRPSLRA